MKYVGTVESEGAAEVKAGDEDMDRRLEEVIVCDKKVLAM
jgi:hypothetical protein